MYNSESKYHNQLILLILLSIHFPCFCTQQIDNVNCEPFECGNIKSISYPFWGGRRHQSCGRAGFELVCHGGVPIIDIASLSYRVQEIDFSTNTMRVARQDLWNTTCPEVLHNTTIDPYLFRYSPESNDRNVTLYFDCTNNQGLRLPNQFRCDGDGVNTINLFRTGDASSGISCNNNISVPVNRTAVESLRTPTASSINVLQDALAAGFSIQWWEDVKLYAHRLNSITYTTVNHTTRNCKTYSSCVRGGVRGSVAPTPTLAPEGSTQGYSPIQSPVDAPTPLSDGHDNGSYHSPNFVQSPAEAPAPLSDNHDIGSYYYPSSGHHLSLLLVIILGIIGIAIVSITIYCWLKRRRLPRKPDQRGNQDVENILLQHGSLALKRYKYSQIKKITKSFSDKLGQGGYGCVYKGILPDGCSVAVKVLMETDSNGKEFINEVASISRTSHVNIVNLLGFCDDRNKTALVYEFMPNRSLDKFISSKTNCRLDLEKLYKIAIGVAKGLEYLHWGCNTRIVHFDIKPQNILLDEDFCPKISDFGLAKLCKKKQSILSTLGARGTIGYIAPEIFSRNFGGVSHKSDVYSYGMMVLEMLGGRNIVEIETIQSSENYFPDQIYEEVILDVNRKLDGFVIEEEDDTTRKMFLVGFWCIQTNPSNRPSISKVVEMLEGTLESIRIPPKPFLFSPEVTRQEFSPSLSEQAETENLSEG